MSRYFFPAMTGWMRWMRARVLEDVLFSRNPPCAERHSAELREPQKRRQQDTGNTIGPAPPRPRGLPHSGCVHRRGTLQEVKQIFPAHLAIHLQIRVEENEPAVRIILARPFRELALDANDPDRRAEPSHASRDIEQQPPGHVLPHDPVNPHPLLGVLANPCLDHAEDHLHGALDVDPAGDVAGKFKRSDQFESMPLIRQAYRARTVHQPILTPRQTSQGRIDPAGVAKKADLHAAGVSADPPACRPAIPRGTP